MDGEILRALCSPLVFSVLLMLLFICDRMKSIAAACSAEELLLLHAVPSALLLLFSSRSLVLLFSPGLGTRLRE